jgi:hypothetical protein
MQENALSANFSIVTMGVRDFFLCIGHSSINAFNTRFTLTVPKLNFGVQKAHFKQ